MQMVLALKPLHDEYKIKRVVVSTYQAVSGAGKASVDELFQQTEDYLKNKKITENSIIAHITTIMGRIKTRSLRERLTTIKIIEIDIENPISNLRV